jgi:hypothetical protein
MTKTTFDQPEPDKRGAFDPTTWEAVGISKDAGLVWWRHRIEPDDALRWRRSGVAEPIDAVRWKIAGVRPDTVRQWLYSEIDAREAVAWSELGFDASDARKHKRAGRSPVQAYGRQHRMHAGPPPPPGHPPAPSPMPRGMPHAAAGPHRFMEAVRRRGDPRIVHSYTHRQWFDDEAIAWAVHGIDASEAVAWKELGLTPVEAERQQTQGMNAMQTAKAWWKAGIPFDEVADWMGAGLTPDEAAEQRANGVTAERAAVLRSLRKDK